MSTRALAWAWQQNPKSAAEKLVLLALADRADQDGECFPSLHWLSEQCGPLAERTVRRALSSLSAQGYLSKVERRRRSSGKLGTWLYRLALTSGLRRPVDQWPSAATGQVAFGGQSVVTKYKDPLEDIPTSSKEEVGSPSENGEQPSDFQQAENAASSYVAFFADESKRLTGQYPLKNARARLGRYVKDLIEEEVPGETIEAAITELVKAELGVGAFLGVADQLYRKQSKGKNLDKLFEKWEAKLRES